MAETTVDPQPPIRVPEVVQVGAFAEILGIPVTRLIGELMKNGVMATINEQIDFDTAAIIGSELGFEIEPELAPENSSYSKSVLPEGEGITRPPVVAIMGH